MKKGERAGFKAYSPHIIYVRLTEALLLFSFLQIQALDFSTFEEKDY